MYVKMILAAIGGILEGVGWVVMSYCRVLF